MVMLGDPKGLIRYLFFLLLIVSTVHAQSLPRPAAPIGGEMSDPIVIKTEMVSLAIGVTDTQGRFFGGLEREAFAVYEDGIKQEVSYFKATDSPASVGIVFDFSNSMTGERIERARLALARFIHTSHPDDEYSLIGFNDRAQVLVDRTRDDEVLLRRIRPLKPSGRTALYDAIALGIEQVQQGNHAKRALIIISDGEDNFSRLTFNQLRRLTQETDVMLYSILISDFFTSRKPVSRLGELVVTSGGNIYSPSNAEQMSEAFDRIALELRQQYSLGYVPTNFVTDGKWRKLKVTVTPPKGAPSLKLRHRTGFYAVADQAKGERDEAVLRNN